ncbi:MAG: hypothetical protein ACRDTM_09180 [Micromonosporaceae bacterium]
MSSQGPRFSRATAERLLAGGAAVEPRTRRLAALLDAAADGVQVTGTPTTGPIAGAGGVTTAGAAGVTAAGGIAPAAPRVVADRGPAYGVPAGETAALVAYRAAAHKRSPQPRRESVITKYFTLKVAVGVATVLTAGGVAVAAGNGGLPDPAADQAAAHRTGAASTASPGKASPSPSLTGLCKAYDKVATKSRGKALDSPAFRALVAAAGGKNQVDGYCEDLLAADKAPGADPSAAPDHPNGPPGDHPGGGATDHPTGPPTERPTH